MNDAIAAAKPLDLFHQALANVLVHEGGKVDHPKDPGGRTNRGVTQRVYNAWRTKSHLPLRDVYQISDMEVEAIYRYQYWEPIRGDQLPPGLGYVVFDGAVNSGVKQSVKWLQRALGFLAGDPSRKVDGVIGSVTLNAAQQSFDHDQLIAGIIDRREAFLRALKTFTTFGKGWLRRIYHVEQTGQAWAMGSVGPAVEYIPGADQKAVIEDAKAVPPKAPGDVSIGVGGAGAALPQAIEQLTPFSSITIVQNVIVGLTVLGVVIMLGGAAYRWWATRRTGEIKDALDIEPTGGVA